MMWFKLLMLQPAFAATIGPVAFPIFLKEGFSSILEFEEAPTQVVLGDPNVFQVEKLNNSIVIKPLANYATTNMFVYFRTKDTRLFILAASEDAEPTYYKKFTAFVLPAKTVSARNVSPSHPAKQSTQVVSTIFDSKKDYLTVETVIAAGSGSMLAPDWDLARLRFKSKAIQPTKLWSERREVMKDSEIKARFVFAKPNVPADLRGVSLTIPIKGSVKAISLPLKVRL
jgi:hypothetical protein